MATVSKLLTPNPVSVRQSTLIATCGKLMHEHKIRHLVVVDDHGHLSGVILDHQLAMRGTMMSGAWVPFDDADQWLLARDLSTEAHLVVPPDEPMVLALGRLASGLQDIVVVVDKEMVPLGVVTEHDGVALAPEVLGEDTPSTDDLATDEVVTISKDTPALKARELMLDNQIRHIVVVDDEGVLHGVISFRDVAVESLLDSDVRASEMIVRRPIYVEAPASMADAARIMVGEKIGCIPVVDKDHRPTVVITRTDILKAVVDALRMQAR